MRSKDQLAVISLLEQQGTISPRRIDKLTQWENKHTHNILGHLVRIGAVKKVGKPGHPEYRLSARMKSKAKPQPLSGHPDRLYGERVRAVHEVLTTQHRITFKEISELLNGTRWALRKFLDEACMRNDLFKQGKQGFFLSFTDYESYVENMHRERLAKRRENGAAYRAAYRASKPKARAHQPDVQTVEINIVCEECRQNWQGYQVHKIFGSGARA